MNSETANQLIGLAWVFGWVAFFVVLRWMSLKQQRAKLELIHRERLAAMEKGVPMPELPDYEESSKPGVLSLLRVSPRWPLGLGGLLIATGAGVSVALALSQEAYHNRVWSMGLIGVFLGLGFFAFYALTRHGR